jgi:hypothetical protein
MAVMVDGGLGFGLDWIAWGLGFMCSDRLGFGLFGVSVHIPVLYA